MFKSFHASPTKFLDSDHRLAFPITHDVSETPCFRPQVKRRNQCRSLCLPTLYPEEGNGASFRNTALRQTAPRQQATLKERSHYATDHMMATRSALRYDSNLCLKWDLAHSRRQDNDMFTTGRCETMTTEHAVLYVCLSCSRKAASKKAQISRCFEMFFWFMQP
jgi:hypothetical protein